MARGERDIFSADALVVEILRGRCIIQRQGGKCNWTCNFTNFIGIRFGEFDICIQRPIVRGELNFPGEFINHARDFLPRYLTIWYVPNSEITE